MFQTFPSQQNKKWIVNYASEFLGHIIRAFNLDLFSRKSFIKTGDKIYPHTTQSDITGLEPATAFCKANIDDGDMEEREKKLWAVAGDKIIKMQENDFTFDEDDSDGFASDEKVNGNSDLLSVSDETEEAIETTPVAITGTSYNHHFIQLDTDKWAQSFRANGEFVKITFEGKKFLNPTDNLTISIQEDSNGKPSGTAIAEYDMPASKFTTYSGTDSEIDDTAYEEEEVLLSDFGLAELELDVSKIYWVVFERSGASDTDNFFIIKAIYSTTAVYSRGEVKLSGEEIGYSAVTSFKSPTTTGSMSGEWTNPTNAYASDDTYATTDGVNDETQDYGTFSMEVPSASGVRISGIEVQAEIKVASGEHYVAMWVGKDYSTYSSVRYKAVTTTEAYLTFGGENDLWGLTWTPDEVNDVVFNVKIKNQASAVVYSLDHIRVKVYYNESGEDKVNYYGINLSVDMEFPSAYERLYLTTSKDVLFLSEDNHKWYSLWRGILQKDDLNEEYPSVLKNLESGGTLILGNDNKIHTMVATADDSSEADENKLIFEPNYYVNWMGVTSSAVFIGLQHKEGELLPSRVVYYEVYSERTRIFQIEEGATVGFIVDDNCHIIDKTGQVRYFTGALFKPYQYFPPYYRGEKITLPHRNGIVVKGDMIKILWEGQYPDPAGIWILEGGNLYHKHSLVFNKTTLNSLGAMEAEELGALFEEDELFMGASLLDGSGSEIKGVYSSTEGEGVSVADDQRTQIMTAKLFSPHMYSLWQDMALKYDPVSGGEFIVKQKIEAATITEGSGATAFNGVWTADDVFTCSDTEFVSEIDAGNIAVGDEIIVRKGQGAGLLAHITEISGTTTKTITIDEGLTAISSGSFTFSVEKWEKMIFNSKDTKFSHKASLKDDRLEFKQFKIDIRKHALEEISVQSIIDKTLIRK